MDLWFRKWLCAEFGLALILAAALWGIAFPDGIAVIYLLLVVYLAILIPKGKIRIRIHPFSIMFYCCIFLFFWGLLLSDDALDYKVVEVDMNRIKWCLVFMAIVYGGLHELNFHKFLDLSKKVVVFFMFILSVIGLYKFYLLLHGVHLPLFYFRERYAYGTVLSSDMNMFSLAMLIGLVMALSLFHRAGKLKYRLMYLVPIVSFTATIFFSGSRRGFILTMLVFAIVLFKVIKSHISKIRFARWIPFLYFTLFIGTILFAVAYISDNNVISKFTSSMDQKQFSYTLSRFTTISPDNIDSTFSSRSDRWTYAVQMLHQETSLVQFLFGSGFDYVGIYRDVFTTTYIEDYPHNPILSALLYSGVVGGLTLTLMCVYTFYNLFKYRKHTGLHFILIYCIAFFYIMISGNSVFSYLIFVFLMILVNEVPYIVGEKKLKESTLVLNCPQSDRNLQKA